MNIALKLCKQSVIYRNILRLLVSQNVSKYYSLNVFKLSNQSRVNIPKISEYKFIFASSVLTWLGLAKNDEHKDSELIMTLKRSVLVIKKGEYAKAEKMLHLALKLAQEQHNEQGVLYVYDLMANLALEREQFEKARTLFVIVLQQLFRQGTKEDDLKAIHISLKLARICEKIGENEKAEIGFKWCLETIKKKLTDDKDIDTIALHGVILDWYAHFLLDKGEVIQSIKFLKEAYKICCEVEGERNEKSVLLLNDIGTASLRLGDSEAAEKYLTEAVVIGETIVDFVYISVIYSNLGLINLQKGLTKEAEKYCKEGWRLARKLKDSDALEQANYCLEQIREYNKQIRLENVNKKS